MPPCKQSVDEHIDYGKLRAIVAKFDNREIGLRVNAQMITRLSDNHAVDTSSDASFVELGIAPGAIQEGNAIDLAFWVTPDARMAIEVARRELGDDAKRRIRVPIRNEEGAKALVLRATMRIKDRFAVAQTRAAHDGREAFACCNGTICVRVHGNRRNITLDGLIDHATWPWRDRLALGPKLVRTCLYVGRMMRHEHVASGFGCRQSRSQRSCRAQRGDPCRCGACDRPRQVPVGPSFPHPHAEKPQKACSRARQSSVEPSCSRP